MAAETFAAAFARRFQYAHYLRQLQRNERISQREIAEAVSDRLHHEEPLRAASVSRWMLGQSVPDAEHIGALAAVLAVDPGWLAYGTSSSAAAPYTTDVFEEAAPYAEAGTATKRRR